MKKQAILQKLARVRLAINYVLRDRMTKQGYYRPEPKPPEPTPVPFWEANPYSDGTRFESTSPITGGGTLYFMNEQDMMNHNSNPDQYPIRAPYYFGLPQTFKDNKAPEMGLENRWQMKQHRREEKRTHDMMKEMFNRPEAREAYGLDYNPFDF